MAEARGLKYNVNFSPGSQGSSDLGRSKAQKSDRTRRSWSLREEEILQTTLKELVAQGWKSDNGFRPGYLNKVEEAIRRELPATDLNVSPNIISKITSWKKNYYSLQGILSRSGVGFNLRGDYMVDCDAEQWEQIIKVDGNARFIRNKPWPYWEDWKEVFGKDRANGSNAEDVMDAVNDMRTHDNLPNFELGGDYTLSFEDLFANNVAPTSMATEAAEDSVCQGDKVNTLPKKSGKKRKAVDGMEGIYDLLKKMHEDADARLQSLSTRIGYEVDLSKARKEVFDILGKIPGLSLDDKFDVCEILVKEAERLDLFIGLPEIARQPYVLRILREKHTKST